MKPENETLEGFKLKCFKLSLTDFALVWYYSLIAGCADYYEDLRARFLKEFSPPSLRHETREKIIYLQQSRDETLDEYYTYFDTIVSRCPHHGFTNVVLFQKFLGGMRPFEWKRFNDAVGGSVVHLTMADVWDLIDDLAESTKRGPMNQTDEMAQMKEANLEMSEENIAGAMMDESDTENSQEEPSWELTTEPSEDLEQEADLVWDEEKPSWEHIEPAEEEDPWMTEPPEEVPNATDELPETYPALTTEVAEEIQPGLVLTNRLAETEPVLMMEASKLFPLINMRIMENNVINGEPERRMEKRPKQNDFLMEHSFATTRQGSLENKKARLKGPAAMVKGASPSQRYIKEEPPEQWSPEPSSSFNGNLGQNKAGAAAK
ncbi:unnamed protein product [Rhodiola kirilowii]